MPSASGTLGSHFRIFLALVMSGLRCLGSSCGSGLWTILLLDLVARDDGLGELQHRHLGRVADVHRQVVIAHHQPVDAFDQIGDVAKAARLRALAENRDGLVRERLADERRHDAAVVQPHPRAVGVEDADDARLDLVLAVIGHRQRLGEALGLVVAAARADGVDVAPVFFRSADGRAGRRKSPRSRRRGSGRLYFWRGRAPCACRASRPSWSGSGFAGNQSGWRARRNARRNPPAQSRKINSVTSCWMNLKFGLPPRCDDVVHRAGDKIVEADDLVAARQQQVGQVRAEKTGGAGDDGSGLFLFQAELNC